MNTHKSGHRTIKTTLLKEWKKHDENSLYFSNDEI